MNTKCRDCKYLEARKKRSGSVGYWCGHPDDKHVSKYFREHQLQKASGFLCYAAYYTLEPTIKTSPAWCPLKRRKS